MTIENLETNRGLLTPLELLIKHKGNLSPEELAKEIINIVASASNISYGKNHEINLLTAPARVLITIIEQPTITTRALAIYMGISEAAIVKSLKLLLDNNLVAKTKVNGKNNYTVVKESFKKHSDITHFLTATVKLGVMGQLIPDDDIFQ